MTYQFDVDTILSNSVATRLAYFVADPTFDPPGTGGDSSSGRTATREERAQNFFDFAQKSSPEVAELLLHPMAQKIEGRGDAANLAREITLAGFDLSNKAMSHDEHLGRLADDLARYDVRSFGELASSKIRVNKNTELDVFYNSRTGEIIPTNFGSDTGGHGRTIYNLRNYDGTIVPDAAWKSTSDREAIQKTLALAAIIGGAAYVGAGTAASGAGSSTAGAAVGGTATAGVTTAEVGGAGASIFETLGGYATTAAGMIKTGGEAIQSAAKLGGTAVATYGAIQGLRDIGDIDSSPNITPYLPGNGNTGSPLPITIEGNSGRTAPENIPTNGNAPIDGTEFGMGSVMLILGVVIIGALVARNQGV